MNIADHPEEAYLVLPGTKSSLEMEISHHGGLILKGLYHGQRRVRAVQLMDYEFFISSDEKDLRSAIGGNCVPDLMASADLTAYGLSIKPEIGPVEIQHSPKGETRVVRTDNWGDGALPFLDSRSYWEKFIRDIYGNRRITTVDCLLPLAAINHLIASRVPLSARKVIGGIYLGLAPLVWMLFPSFSELIESVSTLQLLTITVLPLYITISGYPFLVSVLRLHKPYDRNLNTGRADSLARALAGLHR